MPGGLNWQKKETARFHSRTNINFGIEPKFNIWRDQSRRYVLFPAAPSIAQVTQ